MIRIEITAPAHSNFYNAWGYLSFHGIARKFVEPLQIIVLSNPGEPILKDEDLAYLRRFCNVQFHKEANAQQEEK